MKPAVNKLLVLAKPSLERIHPIVLKTTKTLEDYIGLLDTNIHFTAVHAAADKKFHVYPIGQMMNRYPNIIIPEEGRNMWHLKEAVQATSFYPLNTYNVVVGTCEEMRKKYPEQDFLSNQKNPDVCHNYTQASFNYKGSVGLDFKNIMGKTRMDGQNQVLIGSHDRYKDIMDMYETTLFAKHNVRELKQVLDELRVLAKNNDWNGQILKLAENMHKFPEKWFPPLFTEKKIPLNVFTPTVQEKIDAAIRAQRSYSRRAYELNIPEDNFDQSHVQVLLSNT